MGGKTSRGRRKISKKDRNSSRLGNASNSCYRKTSKKIKKAIYETKEGKTLTCSEILKILNCFPNFLGCFSQDSIDNLFLQSLPCIFLVNIDSSKEPGSHWIVIAIFEQTLEIFDPLGFKFYNWRKIPCQLLRFLHSESTSKKLLIAPQIQSLSSTCCALFCIYFVFHRYKYSFRQILSHFSLPSKNDNLLFTSFFH